MRGGLAAVLVASLGCAEGLDAEPAPPISVKALFANPTFASPSLSDDGETIALIHSRGDLQLILTRPLTGDAPEMRSVAQVDDPDARLHWIEWANSKRLLISAQGRNPVSTGVRARMTRLFGVDADGKNFGWLGRRWPYSGQANVQAFIQDNILHWTPNDPDYVLIAVRGPYRSDGLRVMRMNVNTGKLLAKQGPVEGAVQWFADRHGEVRAVVVSKEREFYECWTRIDPKDPLELTLRKGSFSRDSAFAGFHSDDPARIYVTRDLDDRSAIYEYDLREKKLGALVFAHPEVDVDGLLTAPGGDSRVIGVQYTTDVPRIHFLDAAAERERSSLAAAFTKALGDGVQFAPTSFSASGDRQILRVSADTQPPQYFVFERTVKRLFPLIDERPDVSREQLSPTQRVTYPARDGLAIPAYLTLPKGRDPKKLPLILLVHGGPWARDVLAWDPEVQLFASRGFAVLQPNFRGSSGLGRKHLEAGYREWGQKIQDDISDGVKWAVAQGLADADRVGIYGGSFGGYATLVGVTKTPDLYRAGAAYASVTDIEQLIQDDDWYSWAYDWHDTMIGGERGDRDRLRAASPLRNVASVRVPVLLGHGEDDQRVHVKQSRRMADALRAAGKDVQYLEFEHEVHGFLLEANRIRWYEALIAFFEKNLAPRAASAGTAEGAR